MNPHYLFGSLTRISPLPDSDFEVLGVDRERWRTGDYVVGEVLPRPGSATDLELPAGRMVSVGAGDLVVGAFGRRAATLEATGDWRAIGEELRMEALTGAGLFGRCTSRSSRLAPLMSLRYRGHVIYEGSRATMRQFAPAAPQNPPDLPPVVLIIGTSMSAGKTTAARVLIRLLRRHGLSVAAAKISGAGRYRDVLSMGDAGADPIFDFVDAGLPSTVVPTGVYRSAIRGVLGRLAGADVAVVETGASPMEPYNAEAGIDELGDAVRCVVACASDPYAVIGLIRAFDRRPDMVAGMATSTDAGVELVGTLAEAPAFNLMDSTAHPAVLATVLPLLGL